MSVHVTSWVWQHSQSTLGSRLVLLSIADQAHDDGTAFPSIPNIARRCKLSERQVQRCIRTLVEMGELAAEPRKTPKGDATSYMFTVNPG